MKILLLALIALSAITIRAQDDWSDQDRGKQEILRAIGYCYGQQRSIDRIKSDFPQLRIPMIQAEAEFGVTFGKSCDSINKKIPPDTNQSLRAKLDELLPQGPISEASARSFVAMIRSRAKGDIESPVKEILLSLNPDFEVTPSLEFARGFTKRFSTLGHAKSRDLHLEFSVPASWSQREGNRPHIVQFFKAKYGHHDPSMTVLIDDFIPPKGMRLTRRVLDSLFSPANLKSYVPDGATLIESRPVTIDGQKGGMWIYEITMERLDMKVTMRTLQFATVYKNKLISIQFACGGFQSDRKSWIGTFDRNRTLFALIANSLVIMDRYTN